MLDCINIFTSAVFESLTHGDVDKKTFCNSVMIAVFEAQVVSYVNSLPAEPMTLYVALVQKTMGHSFCLVGVCELNYSVLDKNRPVVDQN